MRYITADKAEITKALGRTGELLPTAFIEDPTLCFIADDYARGMIAALKGDFKEGFSEETLICTALSTSFIGGFLVAYLLGSREDGVGDER